MTEQKRDADGPTSAWSAVGRHAGWGMTLAASIGFFLWLGLLADRWLGTLPVLTILGAFVGGAAGFYSMFRQLVTEPREDAPRDDADASGEKR
ncbi:MAG: AtpZ/AtpI family protein [Gemmatimonadota bacterium]|jgi:hypothetical protein